MRLTNIMVMLKKIGGKIMQKFLISVECACDLDKETIEKYNIQVAPMEFIINGTVISSLDPDFSSKKVAQFMREGAETKTTQINEYAAKEYLGDLMKQGLDVIHISFSSAMSNTYNNFNNAAAELNKTHENKVVVVDSLCQSGGVGVLVKMLLDEIDNGSINNIYDAKKFAEKVRLNIAHYFTVDNLKYLARGGRISGSKAFIGNLLQLKPILRLDDTGTIVPFKKVMGRKTAIKALFDLMKETYIPLSKRVIITEADCEDDAKTLKDMILSQFNIDVTVVSLSPLVTTHSGPGTLALYYTLNKR